VTQVTRHPNIIFLCNLLAKDKRDCQSHNCKHDSEETDISIEITLPAV